MTPLRPAVEMSDALGGDRYAAVRAPVPPSDCLSQLDFGPFCSLKKPRQTAYAEENIFSPRRLSDADPACRVVPPDGRVCPVVLQASMGARQSSAFTDFEHRSTFLIPLKNKGLKEERVAKVGVDHLDKSTTLESNKSLICYASSPTRGFMHQSRCAAVSSAGDRGPDSAG
jgi:hypothetical protein